MPAKRPLRSPKASRASPAPTGMGLPQGRCSALVREGLPVLAGRCAQHLAKPIGEMTGTGKPARQGNLPKWLPAATQQQSRPLQAPRQYILMGRQAEAGTKHPRKVVFRQRAQPGQLTQAQRLVQAAVDVLHQQPSLMRRQTAFQSQALAHPHLIEQRMADQLVGQAAAEQAPPGSSQSRLISWRKRRACCGSSRKVCSCNCSSRGSRSNSVTQPSANCSGLK